MRRGTTPTFTRLWTNSSPSATFAAQDIQLSDSADNYDAIKIVWKGINTQSATADNYKTDPTALSVMYETYNLSSRDEDTGQGFMATAYTTSSYTYIRRAWFPKSLPKTYLHIGPTQRTNNANSNAAYNIPLLVEGVKY